MIGEARARWADQLSRRGQEGSGRLALELAVAFADLCVMRRVEPNDKFVTWCIDARSFRGEDTDRPLVRLQHGPILVLCEYGCDTYDRASELVKMALRASVREDDWAPMFVELIRSAVEGTDA